MELYQERPEQMSKGEKKGAVAGEEGEADKEEPKNLLAAKKWWGIGSENELSKWVWSKTYLQYSNMQSIIWYETPSWWNIHSFNKVH